MKNTLLTIFLVILASSCATVTRGKTDGFVINSNVPNVQITTSTGYFCTTPCAINLPRKDNFTVTAKKDGYCTARASVISARGDGGGAAMAGNVLLGGLIGAGVDANNKSMNDLKPNPLFMELEKCDVDTEA